MSRRESVKLGLHSVTTQKESSRREKYLDKLTKNALAPERSVLGKNPALKQQVTNASLIDQASSVLSGSQHGGGGKDPLLIDSVMLPASTGSKEKDSLNVAPAKYGLMDHWQMQNITERSTNRERDGAQVTGSRNGQAEPKSRNSPNRETGATEGLGSTIARQTHAANDTLAKSSPRQPSPGSPAALIQQQFQAELNTMKTSSIEDQQEQRMNVIGLMARGQATPPTIQQIDQPPQFDQDKRTLNESSLQHSLDPGWEGSVMKDNFGRDEMKAGSTRGSAREVNTSGKEGPLYLNIQPATETKVVLPGGGKKKNVKPVELVLNADAERMSPRLVRVGGHVDQMPAFHVHTSTLLRASHQLQPYRRSPRANDEAQDNSYGTNRAMQPPPSKASPLGTERVTAGLMPLLNNSVNMKISKNRNSTTGGAHAQRTSRQFRQSQLKQMTKSKDSQRYQPSPPHLSKSQIGDMVEARCSKMGYFEGTLAENLFGGSRKASVMVSSRNGNNVEQRPDILDMLDNIKLPPALFSADGGSRAIHTSIDFQPGLDSRRATLAHERRETTNNSLIKVVPISQGRDPFRSDFANSMKGANRSMLEHSTGHVSTDLTASQYPGPQVTKAAAAANLYSNPGNSILYQLQGGIKDSPRNKKYLTAYKNFVDTDGCEMHQSEGIGGTPGISGGFPSLLSDRRFDTRVQDAKRDIIKFYRPELTELSPTTVEAQKAVSSAQAKDRIRNQELHRQFLTQSSHYKYSRLKDGDWGLKGPMRDHLSSIVQYNESGIETRMVPDSRYAANRKRGNNGLKPVHQINKQRVTRKGHHLNMSVDNASAFTTSGKARQLFKLDESLKQKRYQIAESFLERSGNTPGASIFASVAEDEMRLLKQRNTEMLQDQFGSVFSRRSRAENDFLDQLCDQKIRSTNSSALQFTRDADMLKIKGGEPNKKKHLRRPRPVARDSMNLYNSNATPLIASRGGDTQNGTTEPNDESPLISENMQKSDPHASTLYKHHGSIVGALGSKKTTLMPESGQPSLISHPVIGEFEQLQIHTANDAFETVAHIQEATPARECDSTPIRGNSTAVRLMQPMPSKDAKVVTNSADLSNDNNYGLRSPSPRGLGRQGTEDTEQLGGINEASATAANRNSSRIIMDSQKKSLQRHQFGQLVIEQGIKNRNVVYQQVDGKDSVIVEGIGQVPAHLLVGGLANPDQLQHVQRRMQRVEIEMQATQKTEEGAVTFSPDPDRSAQSATVVPQDAQLSKKHIMNLPKNTQEAQVQPTEMMTSDSRDGDLSQHMITVPARNQGPPMPTERKFVTSKQTKFDFSRLSTGGGEERRVNTKPDEDSGAVRKRLRSLRRTTIGFMQNKPGQKIDVDQFEAKKDAALLSHYAGQNLTRNCEENRRMRLKLISQLEDMQKAIKERKRAIASCRKELEASRTQQQTQTEHYFKLQGLVEGMNRDATAASLKPTNVSRPDSLIETARSVTKRGRGDLSSTARHATQSTDVSSMMCRQLLENDLLTSRDQTLQRISEAEAERPMLNNELEQLRQDNHKLKGLIKRYQTMVKEAAGTKSIKAKQALQEIENSLRKKVFDKQRAITHNRRNQGAAAEREAMDSELYRQSDRLAASASPLRGATGSNTSPRKTIKMNAQTTVSYGRVHRGPGQIIDTKRFEIVSIALPLFNRIKLPVDSLVSLLNTTKAAFRGEVKQATLFVLDQDIQKKVLEVQPERKHCFKRLNMGGKNVYAVFATPDQQQKPRFNSLHEAQNVVCTPTQLVLPIFTQPNSQLPSTPGQPSLVLQLAYDPVKLEIARKGQIKEANAMAAADGSAQRRNSIRGGRPIAIGKLRTRILSQSGSEPCTACDGSVDARSDISGTSIGGGAGVVTAAPVQVGFGPNDVLLTRILGQYFALSCQYFQLQVVRDLRAEKVKHVLEFAIDLMQARYFREIIRGMRKHCSRLLDCETATLFFKDIHADNLFTIATVPDKEQEKKKDEPEDPKKYKKIDTSFAYELVFPDDQIVVLPGDMGITGDVFQKNAIKVENDFGVLISQHKNYDQGMTGSVYESDIDGASDVSCGRGSTIKVQQNPAVPRKSTRLPAQSQSAGPSPVKGSGDFNLTNIKRQTALGQILEENPINESEVAERGLRHGSKVRTSKASTVDLKMTEIVRHRPSRRVAVPEKIFDANEMGSAGMPQHEPGLVGVSSAESLVQRALRSATAPKESQDTDQDVLVNASAPPTLVQDNTKGDEDSVIRNTSHGDILSLRGRGGQRDRADRAEASRYVRGRATSMPERTVDPAREVTAAFMPNIDNFAGVKNLKSYCIVSLKDDGYAMGERAVGVLQLFNKTDGRNMDRDDAARIQCVSRFLGALAMKACVITCHQKRLICMIERQRKHFKVDFESYMFAPDQGPLSHMVAHCDLLARVSKDYQAFRAREDAAHFLGHALTSETL